MQYSQLIRQSVELHPEKLLPFMKPSQWSDVETIIPVGSYDRIVLPNDFYDAEDMTLRVESAGSNEYHKAYPHWLIIGRNSLLSIMAVDQGWNTVEHSETPRSLLSAKAEVAQPHIFYAYLKSRNAARFMKRQGLDKDS